MSAAYLVDILLENCAPEAAKESNRREILRKLEAVRRRPDLRAEYAQIILSPIGPVPAHAMEDPSCDWWASEAADNLRQELTDLLRPGSPYGVKPGGPTRVYPGATQSWQQTDRDMR